MPDNIIDNILLVGAGSMAKAYAKVLQAQDARFCVVGRGAESAADFSKDTGIDVYIGGIDDWLKNHKIVPKAVIISVGIEQLAPVAMSLLRIGVNRILLEKPAGINIADIKGISDLSMAKNVDVFIAYNRRFYASVDKAMRIINEDGGVTSFRFEFTEWAHKIKDLDKSKEVLNKWFLGNSTHVVDLAFFMGGRPKEIKCYTAGGVSWHPSGSIFSGAGLTDKGALFSYYANWEAPGRWAIEMLTKKHCLIFKPLEKLQIQNLGSVETSFVNVEDEVDLKYKPGLYKEVEAFLHKRAGNLCTITEHLENMKIYNMIARYDV